MGAFVGGKAYRYAYRYYCAVKQLPVLEPSPSRGKVAPPQAVTDEGEAKGLLYFTSLQKSFSCIY